MSNLLTTIQAIAVRAVQSTNPVVFTFGTVTNDNPLRVRIDESTLELEGESLILTANVVEKKIEIDKHTHKYGESLKGHTHQLSGSSATGGAISGSATPSTDIGSEVSDTVFSGRCIENGKTRDGDAGNDKITIILTRALKNDDRVIMLRVCSGQEWIILSRVYDGEETA